MAKHGIDTFISIISRSAPQQFTEQENIWRPAIKQTEECCCMFWPEHFRCGELLWGDRKDLRFKL